MDDLILLVEDDIPFGETVKDYFESNGLSVIWARNGESAILFFQDAHPRLVMLDVMLPDKNGFEVAAEIRKINSTIPLIFMTGTALADKDFSKAYQTLYANNYLEKPIRLQVALAQVKSLLYPPAVKTYTNHNLQVKIDNQHLIVNNQEFLLRDKDIQVFSVLLDYANSVVSRKDILMNVWNSDDLHLKNTLDACISRIKKKLKDLPNLKIKTIYGVGYKLVIKE